MDGQIFVSHSSADVEMMTDFVNILDSGVSLDVDQVVCTSAPGHRIPNGLEPIEYLRSAIGQALLTIFLITPHFLRSKFCKYEVGAAWVLQGVAATERYPRLFFLVDEAVSFDELPDVMRRQCARLHDPGSLFELRDRLSDLGFEMKRSGKWHIATQIFLDNEAERRKRKSTARRIVDVAYVGRRHSCEVFYLFDDGNVRHTWFPNDDGERRWNEWCNFAVPALPEPSAKAIAATSWGDGHTEVFLLCSDGLVRHTWWSSSRWQKNWYVLDSDTRLTGSICASSRRENHIEICGTRHDGLAVHIYRHQDGRWSGWSPFDVPA